MTSQQTESPWDYSRPAYKDFDPFCEPGLVSVLFLSCGKPELAEVCLDATRMAAANYTEEIEWIFMEQGDDVENYRLFRDFPAKRKVVLRQQNYGINNGFNQMWAISRGEFCFILEQDWWNDQRSFDFLGTAKRILVERPEIGIVQCRAIHDLNENWGWGKPEYNPWSCTEKASVAGYKVFDERLSNGHEFLLCQFPNAFSNNPNLTRKSLWHKCGVYPEAEPGSDPRHGETLYAGRVEQTGCAVAHIGKEIYYHAGGSARRRFEAMCKV